MQCKGGELKGKQRVREGDSLHYRIMRGIILVNIYKKIIQRPVGSTSLLFMIIKDFLGFRNDFFIS